MQQDQSISRQSATRASDSVADAWLRASRQQLLEDLAIKDRDLRTCAKKVSNPWGPWWVRALLWFATVFLVAIAIWGIVSLVYVNRLSNGISAARAQLATLNAEIARRVQILSEDDALASSASLSSNDAQIDAPIETGRPVVLSETLSDLRPIPPAPNQQQLEQQHSQYLSKQRGSIPLSDVRQHAPEIGTKIF